LRRHVKVEPVARLLVKFGASPNQESTFGNTAVAQAAQAGGPPQTPKP